MTDDFAKEYLYDDLRKAREAVLRKLDGLSEYDIRRPMTWHQSAWTHAALATSALYD